ncbi:hypothetical protein EDB87DRAFT_56002 [Lactarius vividus]|nr:hypothetical protein EDB87DRAFT_56002 [Lactarius vividus]
MLSFSKIITFAAVAFGTLSQAVPLSPREANTETCVLVPGQLREYLTTVQNQLVLKFQPISSLTPDSVTVSAVSVTLNNVVDYFKGEVVCVKQLAGTPIDEILKDGDSVLTVDDVKDLVCAILAVVFEALAIVLNLVEDYGIVKVLCIVVNVAFGFVKAVIEITGGFKGLLVYYLHIYVTVGPVAGVLSALQLPSPW